ncbi:MAG: class I SAM-dependent methyltransferase [Gammaproteobacteria bacterium]
MIRILENFALKNWQLRAIEGPLRLDTRVFDAFLAAPYDLLPDFQGPANRNIKGGRGKDHPRYGRFIYAFAKTYAPELTVEVGTYCGGTAIGWAKAIVETGSGKLVCVDNDTYSHGSFPEIARKNLSGIGIGTDRYELLTGSSKQLIPELAGRLKGQVDMYMVDGDHTYEGALADIENGLPMLRPGAFVLVHDLDRGRQMDEQTSAHPFPVYEAFMKVIDDRKLEWIILKFIRKHLGIIRV